ncbi:MAG: MipA/OmpV family protein [Gallionellaceae bacterium]|nr:MAG: MipA/OmpV family protein [Gallionellaceae bacterium]
MKLINAIFPLAIFLSTNALASESDTNRMQGDLGLFANVSSSPIRGVSNSATLLPYAYFDYGRVFTRIDTFGVKTLPLGYGHLELVGRIKLDGYQATDNTGLKGIADRQNPVPVGIGTFQLTPLGGLFLYALYDVNRSRGNIYEAVYAAKFPLGKMAVYPQIGIEHYSGDYTRYYYGISAAESAASGYAAYTPVASTNPSLRAMLEVSISGGWFVNLYLQRKWLGAAITGSPLVTTQFSDNGFISIAYRFK